jgi:hypothetical protein
LQCPPGPQRRDLVQENRTIRFLVASANLCTKITLSISTGEKMKSSRFVLFSVVVILSMIMSACQPAAPAGGDSDPLVKAAQAEGQLTVIALPRDWCNYGEAIDAFKARCRLRRRN